MRQCKSQVAVSGRDGTAPDELPKPAGMPMLDVNEISKQIVIEKPAMLSLLGKGMLTSHVRRKLKTENDRALLEFLSLYANRLRRWMEQSISALATRSLHSQTCIARISKRGRVLVCPTHRPSKMTFGSCANGTLLSRRLRSVTNEFSRGHPPCDVSGWIRATEAVCTNSCGDARCRLEIARY